MSNYWWLRGFNSTHSEAPFCGPRPKERIEQSQIEEKSEKAKEVSEKSDKTGKLKQCNFYANWVVELDGWLSAYIFATFFRWTKKSQKYTSMWMACLHQRCICTCSYCNSSRQCSRVTGPCTCLIDMSKALNILLDYVYKGFGGAESSVIYHIPQHECFKPSEYFAAC